MCRSSYLVRLASEFFCLVVAFWSHPTGLLHPTLLQNKRFFYEHLKMCKIIMISYIKNFNFNPMYKQINNWMAHVGVKRTQVTFSGNIFFASKVPEFLHLLLNLVEKHSPLSFFGWNALVLLCCVHCTRFNILSSLFSETKNQPKKIQGNAFLLNWKAAHVKIQALLKEKNLPEKVTYVRLAPSHSITSWSLL